MGRSVAAVDRTNLPPGTPSPTLSCSPTGSPAAPNSTPAGPTGSAPPHLLDNARDLLTRCADPPIRRLNERCCLGRRTVGIRRLVGNADGIRTVRLFDCGLLTRYGAFLTI